jgi:hypothetical protein
MDIIISAEHSVSNFRVGLNVAKIWSGYTGRLEGRWAAISAGWGREKRETPISSAAAVWTRLCLPLLCVD